MSKINVENINIKIDKALEQNIINKIMFFAGLYCSDCLVSKVVEGILYNTYQVSFVAVDFEDSLTFRQNVNSLDYFRLLAG